MSALWDDTQHNPKMAFISRKFQIIVMENKRIRHAIEQAKNAVNEIEEPYRSLAFTVVLEKLLYQKLSPSQVEIAQASHILSKNVEDEDKTLEKILAHKFDWSRYNFIHQLDPYAKYLLILKIALEEFQIDGLTPPEITKILAEKFRTFKTYNAISMALSGMRGNLVDRIQKGNSFAYRISKNGLNYIQNKIENMDRKSNHTDQI